MRTRIHEFRGDTVVVAVGYDNASTDYAAVNFMLSLQDLERLRDQINDVLAAQRLRERVK